MKKKIESYLLKNGIAKFGWNWPSDSGEYGFFYVYGRSFRKRKKNIFSTMENRRSEKLTSKCIQLWWAEIISKTELKIRNW